MSKFALAVCAAIEGSQVSHDGLTGEESRMISEGVAKRNFMPPLRMLMGKAQNLPADVLVRLNKAVSLNEVNTMAIPVTGDAGPD